MTNTIVALYWLVNDFLKASRHQKSDKRRDDHFSITALAPFRFCCVHQAHRREPVRAGRDT